MTIRPFADREPATATPLRCQEPFPADYGPIRKEVLEHIDRHANQEELSAGKTGQRFEW